MPSNIASDLFAPIFTIGRVPRRGVRCIEQQARNILIRPLTHCDGPATRDDVEIGGRQGHRRYDPCRRVANDPMWRLGTRRARNPLL